MAHFVCPGTCRGVADKPGICQAVDCSHYHQSLEKCDCEDGDHQPLNNQTAADAKESTAS